VTLATPADAGFAPAVPTYSGTAGNDINDSASVTVKIYSGSTVSGAPVQTRVATRSGASWTINGSPALAAGTYSVPSIAVAKKVVDAMLGGVDADRE